MAPSALPADCGDDEAATEASDGIHLYVVLATNLLLLLAVDRRAKRSFYPLVTKRYRSVFL